MSTRPKPCATCFTLLQEGKNLKHLNVAISGDLKGQPNDPFLRLRAGAVRRQHHADAAKGMELPAHVDWRLRNELSCYAVPAVAYEKDNSSVDALYMTADKPHSFR
jgi:hypothetical protein